MSRNLKFALLGATALVWASANANAAGFQLKTQSSTLMGLSYAGATAKSQDLSTIFYNPAGMAHMNGDQAEAHAVYLRRFSPVEVTGVTPTGAGNPTLADPASGDPSSNVGSIIPAFYKMWDYDEKIKFGLSLNTPFGLASEYDTDWAGRYHTVESGIETLTLQPSIAYKFNDQWAFGGGIQMQYVDVKLTRALNSRAIAGTPGLPAPAAAALSVADDGFSQVEGDDFAFGYVLGATFQPTEDTRLGISYRSQVQHELEGDVDFRGTVADLGVLSDQKIVAGLNTPAILSFGAYHKFNEKYALLADVAWTGWSSFEEILIQNRETDAVVSRTPQNFDDTMFFSLGVEYTPDDINTFQFGVAYDQAAVDTEDRGLSIPDSDRTWLSMGYQRKLNEKSHFNVGYIYIMADEVEAIAEETGQGTGTVSAEWNDTNLHLLSVGYSYKF